MNKHSNTFKIRRSTFRRLMSSRPTVLVGIVIVFVAATMAGQGFWARPASAVETMSEYCSLSKYPAGVKNNACTSGVRGENCDDYNEIAGAAVAKICTDAAEARARGDVNNTVVTPSPTTTPTIDANASNSANADAYKKAVLAGCSTYQKDTAAALWCLYGGLGQNGTEGKPKSTQDCITKPELQSSTTNQQACITGSQVGQSYLAAQNGNSAKVQDQLDQSQNLSQYLDVLHAAGGDAKTDVSQEADNNYGSYVNGAGKQQALKVTPGTNGAALLFFNGGGWHANDHNSDKVAEGRQGNNGEDAPPGGGATARGYTVIDVTYRLGSSGIYYMFEDVMRGVQHVINNAGLYGIDPARIGIWGDSAGGSLAMRAAGSGKSGAKAAVGWSAPTNAYTGLFRSYKSFLIGMDHSTCIPTDLAGLTNTTDLLNGGSGNVAEYGQGLSSNDFSSLGIGGDPGSGGGNPLGIITEVLTAAQYAASTGQNVESISKQLESGGIEGLSGGVFNLASKKLNECIDNLNVMSPAMFASPMSPPSFLAGFDNDDLVGPEQEYGMRDKLRSLGIRSEALVLEGDPAAPAVALGATKNHLDYNPLFMCDTLNFLDSILQPDRDQTNCKGGASAAATGSDPSAGGGGGSGGGGGGSNAGGGGGGDNNNGCPDGYLSSGGTSSANGGTTTCVRDDGQTTGGRTGCEQSGGTWVITAKSGGYCSKAGHTAADECIVGGGTYSNGTCTYFGSANSNNKTVTGAGKAPAPGKGRAFNIDSSSSATDVNTSIAYTCPSGRADSSAIHGTTITYVCR